jgi:hypothetical protein
MRMSDSAKTGRPGVTSQPKELPNAADAEREHASAQIARSLKAWRKESARAKKGAAVPESAGNALPEATRGKMEPELGTDLSGVRVHTGAESAQAASEFGARAFTVGQDVHFGAGEFAPGTKEGDRLLAHELTHTVQAGKSGVKRKAEPGHEAHDEADVSQPHEPAEQEADEHANRVADKLHGGGESEPAAAPGKEKPHAQISAKLASVAFKIYRDPKGAKPAAQAPAKPATPDPKAKAAPVDPLQPVRDQIAAGSRGGVVVEWGKVASADQGKISNLDISKCFDVSPGTALAMMTAAHLDFSTGPGLATKFLSIDNPAQWQLQLNTNKLFDSLMSSAPRNAGVTAAQAATLGKFWPQVQLDKAKALFEKVYPKLQDATYKADWLKTATWGSSDIERLYKAFAGLPVSHVQASSGGFFLGTDQKLPPATKFQPLGFAWQDGDKMVLPKNSSKPDGGTEHHDMTGGSKSGAKDVAGSKDGGPTQSHFVGSAAHEVGHAVSNKVGGDAWSTTRNAWTVMAIDDWSKALFDDKAADAAVQAKVKSKAIGPVVLTAADARTYLANKISNKTVVPAKWNEANVMSFIKTHFATQPLYLYLQSVEASHEDYKLPPGNVVGGKAYAYHSRFGGKYCTYKEDTYTNKVSWYSVSSPAEWFAENYSHYYRMQGQHPVADVKKYFDSLDQYKWNANPAGGGTLAPGGDAPAAGGDKKDDKGEKGGAQANDQPPPSIHRMAFSW